MKKIDLDKIALDVAEKWRRLWEEGAADDADIIESINLRLEQEIIERLVKQAVLNSQKNVDQLAGKMLDQMVRSDELVIAEPNGRFWRESIGVLNDSQNLVTVKHVGTAAEKLQATVFRMVQGGASEDDIAQTYEMRRSDARTLVKNAKAKAQKIKDLHDSFFLPDQGADSSESV